MGLEQIVPVIFLLSIIFLILPQFLSLNAKLKVFIKNLFIWFIIVASVMIFTYFIF